MKKIATFVFLGMLFACSSNAGSNSQSAGTNSPSAGGNAAVLHPTNMTFQAAEAACAGALGSVTFAMGHARPHALAGVRLNEGPESSNGISTVTFSDKANGKAATVLLNGHDRSVSGKHVTVKGNQSVACVEPD